MGLRWARYFRMKGGSLLSNFEYSGASCKTMNVKTVFETLTAFARKK